MAVKLSNGLHVSARGADTAGLPFIDTAPDADATKPGALLALRNGTADTVSLDRIQIWSAERGLLHAFGAGDTIGPGATVTVAAPRDRTRPAHRNDADDVDTIYLVATQTGEYVTVTNRHPARQHPLPADFPGTVDLNLDTRSGDAPNAQLSQATGHSPDIAGPVCFAEGTRIATSLGNRAVETLRPGLLIWTKDHGFQPLRWIGRRDYSAADLKADPTLRPICIVQGALGGGLPAHDMVVAPQHRMVVASPVVWRMFATGEVLVPAFRLLGVPGVTQLGGDRPVAYFHLLLDQHAVIMANGALSETLLLGPRARDMLGRDAVAEIAAIFPDLGDDWADPVPPHLTPDRVGHTPPKARAPKPRRDAAARPGTLR